MEINNASIHMEVNMFQDIILKQQLKILFLVAKSNDCLEFIDQLCEMREL